MITGSVSGTWEVVVPLLVRDSAGTGQAVDAVLDTGYTGYLTLPPALIATLGLVWLSYAPVMLADGTIMTVARYDATVVWDGRPRAVTVQEVDSTPLIGMKLLLGHDLRVRVALGGAVEIEAIP